ncbi:type II toxin-antitoxin system ParD family antitoxin [Tautonia rosea]|uniref:type II toxin-antitoxin system ParD family antitoxin n=1 Tax=Tautonia rosea TaxID=2728037 RepID=UPI0014732782|nr:type II toxin-antitoxin system ParD family antitoxin [Tautonia rosea]
MPNEIRLFIEAQAAEQGCASAGEYPLALVREAQLRQAKAGIDAKLIEALENGPATPMTREDWDELEREVWERDRQERAGS